MYFKSNTNCVRKTNRQNDLISIYYKGNWVIRSVKEIASHLKSRWLEIIRKYKPMGVHIPRKLSKNLIKKLNKFCILFVVVICAVHKIYL